MCFLLHLCLLLTKIDLKSIKQLEYLNKGANFL